MACLNNMLWHGYHFEYLIIYFFMPNKPHNEVLKRISNDTNKERKSYLWKQEGNRKIRPSS